MILCGSSTISLAAKRTVDGQMPWYEIEVIIFANREQKGLGTETWPEIANTSDYANSITLGFPQANTSQPIPTASISGGSAQPTSLSAASQLPPNAYTFINPSEFQLTSIANKIKNSSKYEPLLHIGWRQPTDTPKKALPVYIFDGMDDPRLAYTVDDRFTQSTQDTRFNQNGNVSPVGPNNQRLYGTIRLSVSRYLHVEPDLHYRAPVIQQEYVLEQPSSSFFNSSAELVERLVERNVILDFNLNESRRLRSKEIHYYDHPMFSMIVMVTPIKFSSD